MAVVDLGDQRVPVQFATPWVPEINEPVWVDSVDGMLRLVGPTTPKPGRGIVSDIDGDLATVVTAFGEYQMPFSAGDAPGGSDPVGIVWSEGARCFRLSVDPDLPTPAPPPPSPGEEVRTAEFRAIAAGSTDRPPKPTRWWTSRPMASATTIGAWFYGTQIKDTIPADAEFVSLEIWVSWAVRRFGPPRWVLHDHGFPISSTPNLSSYVEWEPGADAGWKTPPDAAGWFNALKAGGSWAGVGLNQGGWEEANALSADGASGALRIKWK